MNARVNRKKNNPTRKKSCKTAVQDDSSSRGHPKIFVLPNFCGLFVSFAGVATVERSAGERRMAIRMIKA